MLLIVVPSIYAVMADLPSYSSGNAWDEVHVWIVYLGRIGLVVYLLWRDDPILGMLGLTGKIWREVACGCLIAIPAFMVHNLALDIGARCCGYGDLPEGPIERASPIVLLPITILLGAAVEEMVFRCYLWVRLADLTRSPLLSLLVCSVVFGLAHGHGAAFVLSTCVSGAVWGLCYWATGRLQRVVIAHWVENLVRTFAL